jgi:hypothetical protein
LPSNFLDPQQLVVFADAVGAAQRAGLDLAGVGRHRDIGDGGVFRLTGAMADDRRVTGFLRHLNRIQRFRQRADLVDLYQDRVGGARSSIPRFRNFVLVTNRSSPTSCSLSPNHRSSASSHPSRFREAVFEGNDGVLPAEAAVELDHLFGGAFRTVGFLEDVFLGRGVVELARRGIEGDENVLARLVARLLDRRDDDFDGCSLFLRAGANPPSSPTAVLSLLAFSTPLSA